MSIDARVIATDVTDDGKQGILYLAPRNKMACAGQNKLYVEDFDGWLPPLNSEIWGNASKIYFGDTAIYKRTSIMRVKRILEDKKNG